MGNTHSQLVHPDRLFPIEAAPRAMARAIYNEIKDLPIVSPHGHTDPNWFADNENFENPVDLLLKPDHYLLRMLYSQGISLQRLGIPTLNQQDAEADPGKVWRTFAENFYLFRGTPSALWLNHMFQEVFEIEKPLTAQTADFYFDHLQQRIQSDAFKPRALFHSFRIETLSTTDGCVDPLKAHQKLRADGWGEKVRPCFRPDDTIDPDHEDYTKNLRILAQITDTDTANFKGYLSALKKRRRFYKEMGATATDHGPATAFTTVLSGAEVEALFKKSQTEKLTVVEAENFRGHMLVEMARMAQEDGLVMQIHPGAYRNHNEALFRQFGRDKGADIPQATDYTKALKPLLNEVGNDPGMTLIIFTLDESTYARELAPLAGHYPALKLGPAWWFHDSPEGMRRFREQTTETAGFYNTVGFNDDTRAFLSIPARHDVCRRIDSAILAKWVCEHRLTETDALEVAKDLTYRLVKKNYKL